MAAALNDRIEQEMKDTISEKDQTQFIELFRQKAEKTEESLR